MEVKPFQHPLKLTCLNLLQVSLISFSLKSPFGIELLPFIQFLPFFNFILVWLLTPTWRCQYRMYIPGFHLSRPTLESGMNRLCRTIREDFLMKNRQGWWFGTNRVSGNHFKTNVSDGWTFQNLNCLLLPN